MTAFLVFLWLLSVGLAGYFGACIQYRIDRSRRARVEALSSPPRLPANLRGGIRLRTISARKKQ